jgi:hypothetical protein
VRRITLPIAPASFGEAAVKLNNLKITPKIGILVGVALFGLCVAVFSPAI